MNLQGQQKKGKLGGGKGSSNFNDGGEGGEEENVLVAVKASKEIPKAALIWALTHVVQPGDCISLIVVVPPQSSGRRLWVFPRFAGDCASTNKKSNSGPTSEQKCDEFTESCSQMILQLHDVYDPNKVNVKIKVVSSSPCGAVAAEAKRVQANWVVLEKDLKNEEKKCMEDLHCNIVAMRRSHPKVLRLNLVGSSSRELEYPESNTYSMEYSTKSNKANSSMCPTRGPSVTPSSSPDPFTSTEVGTSSVSSSDPGTSPFFIPETLHSTELAKKDDSYFIGRKERRELLESIGLETETDISTPRSTTSSAMSRPWMMGEYFKPQRANQEDHQISPARALLEKLSKLEKGGSCDGSQSYNMSETDFLTTMREAMSIPRSGPMGPPPLCSICQHKAPVFGKPPRQFSYGELEFATRGFSRANFLAEGGFGSVHRGVLPDGQPIAVKQHKLASSQGDVEFCSEVEVLSCAQHRNVVMLIGYCIEDKRRLLVYEYLCNGSLDSHLYGRNKDTLEWYARQRIAVGAARGLRYLHEECRVGCIIHRDMRPNNILLTHDYEPLVGDFGLARWQPDGDTGVQTRVIGTFGYLAPEYAQSGQITEKTDVYSFGVVLVELLTGRKAVDLGRPKGQQCLTEWARPLLEEYAIDELIDPVLGDRYTESEVNCMVRAASLCIMRDPHSRPRMSQVLRILEGDVFTESSYMSTPSYDGNRSGRLLLQVDQDQAQSYSGSLLKEESEVYKGNFSFNSVRCAMWAREKAQQAS